MFDLERMLIRDWIFSTVMGWGDDGKLAFSVPTDVKRRK